MDEEQQQNPATKSAFRCFFCEVRTVDDAVSKHKIARVAVLRIYIHNLFDENTFFSFFLNILIRNLE